MARACFPNVSQFPIRKTFFSIVRFCFEDENYAYATRQGILKRIRACKQLQKFCEHEQANAHLIFTSNSSKGQILRALSCIPITSPVSFWFPIYPSKKIPTSTNSAWRMSTEYLANQMKTKAYHLEIEDITRCREDMNFMLSWQEKYFMSELRCTEQPGQGATLLGWPKSIYYNKWWNASD